MSSRSNRASTLVGRKRAQGVVLPRKWPVCFMSVRDHTVQIKKGRMFTRWQQLEILFFSFPFSINSLYKEKKTVLVWAFVSLLAVPAPVLFCSTFLPCIQCLLFVCALFALSFWMWFSTVPAASWPELSVWNLFCWLKSYSSSMWYKVWLFGLSLALCGIVVFFTVSFMSHMPANSVTLNYPFCCKCTGSSSSSFYCSS